MLMIRLHAFKLTVSILLYSDQLWVTKKREGNNCRVESWMDVGPKLKWCTFVAVGAVTLGVVCADLSRRRRKKASSTTCSRPTVCEVPREEEMAATIENECPSEPISQLASTMKQLKVSAVDASPIHCSQTGREDSSDSFIPDRDSANHSPDFLSGNLHSDSHSEVTTSADFL